jgi:hypothetical protein
MKNFAMIALLLSTVLSASAFASDSVIKSEDCNVFLDDKDINSENKGYLIEELLKKGFRVIENSEAREGDLQLDFRSNSSETYAPVDGALDFAWTIFSFGSQGGLGYGGIKHAYEIELTLKEVRENSSALLAIGLGKNRSARKALVGAAKDLPKCKLK